MAKGSVGDGTRRGKWRWDRYQKVLLESIWDESDREGAAIRRFCGRRFGMSQIEMESLSEGSGWDEIISDKVVPEPYESGQVEMK